MKRDMLQTCTMRGMKACCLVVLALSIASCEEAVLDPFDNEGRFFTVYGYLDVLEQSHALRVVPLARTPESVAPESALDAVVTTTDLRTGATRTWQHTLERLSNGELAHVFKANFIVQPGHTYRLEVERSDGITATAETTVPNVIGAQHQVQPPQVTDEGEVVQDLRLPEIPSPWEILVVYHVGGTFSSTPYRLSYERAGEPADDGGWRFTMNLSRDRARLSETIGVPEANIQWANMGLQVRVLDEKWNPPEGEFDPEVLAQPGTLSNVENGYGFFGSVGLYQRDWPISDKVTEMMGFEF